jgi:hypothetical protein
MAELFVVDDKGEKREVIIDLERYRSLKGMEVVIDLQQLLQAVRDVIEKKPVDFEALNELLEDIDDLVEVAKRQDEEAIPWEEARRSLTE